MDSRAARLAKRLRKKAKKGLRGYPFATVAVYGPDNRVATKLVASIIAREGAEPDPLQTWHSTEGEIRDQAAILEELLAFLAEHGVLSVAMVDRIIGCPHEEGIDYEGPTCPQCPFWANRDRWTGEITKS